jgi:hypothetical protein
MIVLEPGACNKYCLLFVLYFKLSSDSLVSQLAIVEPVRFIITTVSGLTQLPTY